MHSKLCLTGESGIALFGLESIMSTGYTYREFINDKGNSITIPFSDGVAQATMRPGYYEVSKNLLDGYKNILAKAASVDSYETEFNGKSSKAVEITINETVSGSFGGSTDIDFFKFNVDAPQKIDVSFAYMPSAGLGTLSHSGDYQVVYAAAILYHDEDGDGVLGEGETDPYFTKLITSHGSQSISLGDTGDYHLSLLPGAFLGSSTYLKFSSADYRFIIETDAPTTTTYSVPETGLNVEHQGAGIIINANVDVLTISDSISVDNYGTGQTTITATGAVKSESGDGVSVYNGYYAKDLTISVNDVEGSRGVYADNRATGITTIVVNGDVIGTNLSGIEIAGAAEVFISVEAGATVTGDIGVLQTELGFLGTGDTYLVVHGSVTGRSGTAIQFEDGENQVILYDNAKITGTIDGGTGSDTASFSVAKSAVDTFTYNEITETAVVTVDSTVTTFKDFEYFKFSDDTSAMTTAAAVTTLTKVILTESIGALSVVNSGTSTAPVLDFYLDSSKDPGDAGVTSIHVVLKFDPTHASFTSFSFDSGLLGAANEASAADGTITFGAIALTPASTDKPLFKMTMEDLDSTNDFSVTVSDLNVDGSTLEGSTLVVGSPPSHTATTSVVTRDGATISDVDVVMSDGTNSSSYKSAADGSVSGTLTSGSASTIEASLAYSSSTKAVSSQDALDALKLSVGMTTAAGTKTAFDFISADFNQDGKVSSQDALAILKNSVGFPTTGQAKWVFVDTNGDYSGVSKSNTSYTEGVSIAELSADTTVGLTGILIGDVNDSYSGLIA